MISDYVRFVKVALRAKVDYPPFGWRLTHKIKTRLYLSTFTPYQYLFFSILIRLTYWLVMPFELIKRSHLSQVDDDVKKSTLKNLENDGYVKIKALEIEKFNHSSILIGHVMRLVQMMASDKDQISNQFHKYINLDQHGEELALDLIVDSGLLPVISNYLGAIPVLSDLKIIHSPINRLIQASQLYHCDGEDSRQVKIFFYITSQTEESGPLTLISAKDTQKLKVCNSVPLLGRIEDGVIERAKFQQIKLTGSRGDLALFDPSRVAHYGSRVNSDSRIIIAYQFIRRDAPFGSFWFKLKDSHLIKKYSSTLAGVCMT